MSDGTSQRRHERVRVNGFVRMMVDTAAGVRMASGRLIDLSEGGCSIFVKHRVEENAPARIQVEIAGTDIWLPVVTRWARCIAGQMWPSQSIPMLCAGSARSGWPQVGHLGASRSMSAR
jgi:hypothetical protein